MPRPKTSEPEPLRRELRADGSRPLSLELEQLSQALRAGRAPADRVFDRWLPEELRPVSGEHWTPLAVALRAAQWIERYGLKRIVDIGSGSGKFCVATALACDAQFVGVEHRLRLVNAAQDLANRFALSDRVSFMHTTFGEARLPDADAYYLYNPFGENLFGREHHLDEQVELGHSRYFRDVAAAERLLALAPVGTHLLTYNGFGGGVPVGYREVCADRTLPNLLRLWRKAFHDERVARWYVSARTR